MATLYPKITNHISEVLGVLKHQNSDSSDPNDEATLDPTPIPIIGTIKLHGTHADIVFQPNGTISLQSRNNTSISPCADNAGFASAMAKREDALYWLRDQYLLRYRELNPGKAVDGEEPLTIAGEWIGERIQKGVAVSQMSKRLVLISAKINGSWVADTDYADIEAPEAGIFNISRGGFFHRTLWPKASSETMKELEILAEEVAAECPFARSFGVVGQGEGLVWKLVPQIGVTETWFKTKGGYFKPTFAPRPPKPSATAEDERRKQDVAYAVAKIWCSEIRMEQGWEFLKEMHIPRTLQGIGAFLKWVQNDILVEEKGYIEEEKVDRKLLGTYVVAIAKPWFFRRCNE